MPDWPNTRMTLLDRLGAQEEAAWEEFVDLYGPMVYEHARRRGLQEADAADLVQDVLLAVSSVSQGHQYDRERGRFRDWLFGITRNKILRFLERQYRGPRAAGGPESQAFLEEQPERERDHWEEDWQRQIFRVAADRVRSECGPTEWLAFWQTAVEGKKPADVAVELNLALETVYSHKSRIKTRIEKQVQQLREE